jgi:hypothetical protein
MDHLPVLCKTEPTASTTASDETVYGHAQISSTDRTISSEVMQQFNADDISNVPGFLVDFDDMLNMLPPADDAQLMPTSGMPSAQSDSIAFPQFSTYQISTLVGPDAEINQIQSAPQTLGQVSIVFARQIQFSDQ